MSKRQNYRNNGFRKFLTFMYAFGGNMYNNIFHNKNRNTGKAGGHLDTSYHNAGSPGGHYNIPIAPHKAKIEKKRKRKEVDASHRINRKRANGTCSFKVKAWAHKVYQHNLNSLVKN